MTASLRRLAGFMAVALSLGWVESSCRAQDAMIISPDLVNRPNLKRQTSTAVPEMPLVPPWAYSPYRIYYQQPIYYGVVRVGPDHWHPVARRAHNSHHD